jgi:hypothetical protein
MKVRLGDLLGQPVDEELQEREEWPHAIRLVVCYPLRDERGQFLSTFCGYFSRFLCTRESGHKGLHHGGAGNICVGSCK